LRSDLGGKPLWVTDHNILQGASAVPCCDKCGAPRHFEFQVHYYLRQGGYVFAVVCLLVTFHKNFRMDLHELFSEGWQWAIEQMIKF